jgi:hypothetical protein
MHNLRTIDETTLKYLFACVPLCPIFYIMYARFPNLHRKCIGQWSFQQKLILNGNSQISYRLYSISDIIFEVYIIKLYISPILRICGAKYFMLLGS